MNRQAFWPLCCIGRRVRSGEAGVVLAAVLCALAFTPVSSSASEPVATFSIAAYDPGTGDLGVAVQSKFFAVGSVVPFAVAGVGAVATQAQGNTSYGPRGLAMLEQGMSPDDVLAALLADDEDREHRQVGVVAADGRAAAFTGSECMDWAGHRVGADYTVQGNILVSEETVAAMARAFEETDDILAERLMRAIEAGQAAGGDSRGMQSAAILVVRKEGGYGGFNDRYCDLRVDDHEEPIAELRRLVDMWKHDALIMEGYRLCDKGEWDSAFEVGLKAVAMSPDEGEPHYHLGCYYSKAGRYESALEELKKAKELDGTLPSWAAEDTDLEPLRENPEFRKLLE